MYKKEHQINEELTKKRIEKNPYTDVVLYEGEELIGYISLYPIPEDLFQQLCKGEVDENKIEENVLHYEIGKQYVAYLASIVINKKKAPFLKGKWLFYYLQNHLLKLKRRGIYITNIIAFAVSKGGHSILSRINFIEKIPNIYFYSVIKNGYYFIIPKQNFSLWGVTMIRCLGCV